MEMTENQFDKQARAERAFHDYLDEQATQAHFEPLDAEAMQAGAGKSSRSLPKWTFAVLAAAAAIVVAVVLVANNLPTQTTRIVAGPAEKTTGWVQTAQTPLSGRYGSATAWVDGQFYVIGGIEPCGSQRDEGCVEPFPPSGTAVATGASYDPASDSWVMLPEAPYPVSSSESAVVGRMIYVLGDSPLDQVTMGEADFTDEDQEEYSDIADAVTANPEDDVVVALQTGTQLLMGYDTGTGQWSVDETPVTATRIVALPDGVVLLSQSDCQLSSSDPCVVSVSIHDANGDDYFSVDGDSAMPLVSSVEATYVDGKLFIVRQGIDREDDSAPLADCYLVDLESHEVTWVDHELYWGQHQRRPVTYGDQVFVGERYGRSTSMLTSTYYASFYDPKTNWATTLVGPTPADGKASIAWGGMSYENEYPEDRAPLVVGDYVESMGNFYHVPTGTWKAVPTLPRQLLNVLASSDTSVLSCFGDIYAAEWSGQGGIRECYLLDVPSLDEVGDTFSVGSDDSDNSGEPVDSETVGDELDTEYCFQVYGERLDRGCVDLFQSFKGDYKWVTLNGAKVPVPIDWAIRYPPSDCEETPDFSNRFVYVLDGTPIGKCEYEGVDRPMFVTVLPMSLDEATDYFKAYMGLPDESHAWMAMEVRGTSNVTVVVAYHDTFEERSLASEITGSTKAA
jgi:N-acetylneuraminic acid mutarotase